MRTLVEGHVHLVDLHGLAIKRPLSLAFSFVSTGCVEHAVESGFEVLDEKRHDGHILLTEIHSDLAKIRWEMCPHNVFTRVLLYQCVIMPDLFELDVVVFGYGHRCFQYGPTDLCVAGS